MKSGGGSPPPPLEVTTMKLILRGCPRCHGTLELTKDLGMYVWSCVNCGREFPIRLSSSGQVIKEGEEGEGDEG